MDFFPSEVTVPALDGGVDRLSNKAFLPWSDLVCPLPMQAPYSSLPALQLRWGGDAPGTDLMAPHIDLAPYHNTSVVSPVSLTPFGLGQSGLPRIFPKQGLLGESSMFSVLVHIPEYSPDGRKCGES